MFFTLYHAVRPRRAESSWVRRARVQRLCLEYLEDRMLLAAPVAFADVYVLDENTTLSESAPGVLANDSDDDGDALSAVLLSGPSHGSLALNADGSFDYTPAVGFFGTDAFTYLADDGSAVSAETAVTLTVNPVNDAPTAGDDAYDVDEDGSLTVSGLGVLVNDTDPEGDPLTAWILDGPYYGSATLDPSGALVYTPNPDFCGEDYFVYLANDGQSDSAPATVVLTVNPTEDPPVAETDFYGGPQDTDILVDSLGVLANDWDIDTPYVSAVLMTGPEHGSLTLNSDGSFAYTPHPGFVGLDSFTYSANDGPNDSAPATVYLEVYAVVSETPAKDEGPNGVPPPPETVADPPAEEQPPADEGNSPPAPEVPGTDTTFIQDLYRDLLNRPADGAGLTAWVQFLQAGNSQDVVARAFWRSAEHRARQVDQWYATFLHRDADEAGRTLWVNALLNGAGERDVMLGFVLSGEYQANHRTNESFLAGLYQDALGRAADAAGLSGWLLALQAGVGRDAAARAFLTSPESYGHLVDLMYRDFLARDAAAAEEAAWAGLLQSGRLALEDAAVLILSSPEYRGAA